MESHAEEFCGCVITTIEGDEHNTYVITHKETVNTIYTCNKVSSYKIAKLLDLEYHVTEWQKEIK